MPFSFKPTPGTEIKEASHLQSGGAISPSPSTTPAALSSSSLSYGTRFGGEGRGIIQTIIFSIFGLCVIATVVLFGYQQYLTSQINDKKAKLASAEAELGVLPLDDMRKLSNRIKVVNQALKGHASVRVAFRIIEDSIENPVTYKNFDLHFSNSLNSYELNMGAVATDYHSVIQQIETLKSKTYAKYIPSIIVNGLHPDDSGKVAFNIKMPILITGLLPEEVLPTSNTIQQGSSTLASSTINAVISSTSTNSVAPLKVKSGIITP